jgi:myo-inositol-1(or 4)-monophosphatase
VILVQEAGGVVSEWRDGADWMASGNVVAGNPQVQRELAETVRQTG